MNDKILMILSIININIIFMNIRNQFFVIQPAAPVTAGRNRIPSLKIVPSLELALVQS